MINFNINDMGNISEGVNIIVPPVKLAFIQICLTAQGEKEEVWSLLEAPRNLCGCPPQQDGVINKECVVNGLNPCFKG